MKNNQLEKLSDYADYSKAKISIAEIDTKCYFSKENMLPNKGGVTEAAGLPTQDNVTKVLPENVLVSNIRPYFKKIYFANELAGASNDVLCFVAKNGCLPRYLYYLLSSDSFFDYMMAGAKGTKMPRGDKGQIMNFPVWVPAQNEQSRIVSVLSALDEKIENISKINHNLEEQLYALYASNYDNLSGKKVPLKECCSFQEGYVNPTQTKPEYFDGSVKWLRAVDINESFIISTSRTLTEQGFASAGKSALLFPKDSIAISKSGTIGRLGIVADNMCGNRAVINIVPKQKKWLAFIYCYLKSRQAEFSDLAVGSVQKNLYVSILEPLEIFSPADSVLNDFHFSAQTILEKMKNNCFEMQSLAQLRDALLPKLMSGEIDVSEVEV